jgi:uncharacterized membrane protein
MTHKQDALEQIVTIAKNNGLSAQDIAAAMKEKPANLTSGGILSRLFGYIGGIFVFAGICIFIAMQWDSLGSAARVIITLGTGFTLYLMALAACSDAKYERAATPLFLMSGLLQPTGIMVMLAEYSNGGDARHGVLFMAVVMLVQQALTLKAKDRTALAFFSILFGSIAFATTCDLVGIQDNITGIVFGISLLCLSWAISHSKHAAQSSFWYLVGSISLFWSFFDMVRNSVAEVLYLGLASAMIYLSVHVKSRTLLFVSAGAMLCYISYFTEKHFSNTLGWPVALVIIGLSFIALGAGAVRLNNKYIKQAG